MNARSVTLYLDPPMLASARDGTHNYVNRLRNAFTSAGCAFRLAENSALSRVESRLDPGYSLFHMDPPNHERALTTRRAYFYPFWRIEAVAERWAFRVARETFDPEEIDREAAARFFRFWQKRLFEGVADTATRDGFVFVPLQGLLTSHRSFQTMSPLDMLQCVLDQVPDKPVVATLHPGESYSRAERRALDQLLTRHPRLSLTDASSQSLLQGCDMVVTQNSSVALSGFFFRKPAVLFAQIDFHHIAANVGPLGVQAAFVEADESDPPYDRYLYWFLQQQSINAGKENAEERILTTVRTCGWEL